jgi:hypothetical protein
LCILDKIKLALDKSVAILLLEILDNLWILLKAVESLEIELPTLEKSKILKSEFLLLGDKSKCAGVFNCAVLFFF